MLAAAAGVVSAILPIVGFGLLLTAVGNDAVWLAVLAWLVPTAVALVALLGELGWRVIEALPIGPPG